MRSRHVFALSLVLAFIGLSVFVYKVWVLDFPLEEDASSQNWSLELKATFRADGGPVKAHVMAPQAGGYFSVYQENFISPGFGLTQGGDDVSNNRQFVWSIREAEGEQSLYYRAIVYQFTRSTGLATDPPSHAKNRREFASTAEEAAIHALLREATERSADNETFIATLKSFLNDDILSGNAAMLIGRAAPLKDRVDLAVRVLNEAGIDARTVHGVALHKTARVTPIIHWFEIWNGREWTPHRLLFEVTAPTESFLPWWRGDHPMIDVEGGGGVRIGVAVSQRAESAITSAMLRGDVTTSPVTKFSLYNLPIESQLVYRVLLLIPIGALVIALVRQMIGIRTFGTFMPVLIALSFRETELFWGIVLFTVVVSMGLLVRFYFEHLKLLLVPRLASMLVVVVLLMACVSLLSESMTLDVGLSVALFPMVIMTMTIERMSVLWEEHGAKEAIIQGLGSLGVAALTFTVMSLPHVEHMVFTFPELLLVLLATLLVIGRYTGPRLTELYRFRHLAKR